jgi:predicted 3-demethylubiquinone-9 3-methyltransferase (glyoxalase superfamily)
MQKIVPSLWFDNQAEGAAKFYTSLFKNSKINAITRYSEVATDIGMTPGTVMTVDFELDGQAFNAIHGGPDFKFTEATSFIINCDSQEEMDKYWEALIADGGEPSVCGWLKDKYGLSWQITPVRLAQLMTGPQLKVDAMMRALLQMTKLNLAELQRAYDAA